MRRVYDAAAYEERELRMVQEVVRTLKASLLEHGIPKDNLESAVRDIAFPVAAIVDGSAYLDLNDDHLVPILGFAEGRMRNKLLVREEGGSSLHGLVPSVVEDEFK